MHGHYSSVNEYASTHPSVRAALALTPQEVNGYNTGAIGRISLFRAEVAQLVEHLLAKEKVAGSNPVFRSRSTRARWPSFLLQPHLLLRHAPLRATPDTLL
ncbi:hypothetical protein NITHO_1270003 [Nitrolancea hollandica Lb]|uniref:Uncharacterized protein n=1 Tax=Nitrolancea hollandica Lb TaxID=1129897 RepID=I4ECX7_9BACT|nr:hypothetical protein NITHO_1270003 [Nitrolancea hollandica Lb]